ncbi:MAG: hypothetical protein AVDCRST_MAG56-7694 [uncultured Cytophagales bacterium]|uniref:Uncharacterized protein n=1 Tax=uncultured Cytophagales bacterium TaxID=158755 RepID=A0A6J4LLV1_9SPHI|nr:MAG: hypothetical protein AVDCRST_MAG56-7694 [uncultured Cytophagales bacterium]
MVCQKMQSFLKTTYSPSAYYLLCPFRQPPFSTLGFAAVVIKKVRF